MRERDQGRGRADGGRGARGARAGLGRTGQGWVTPRVKTHDMHNHQSEFDHELKSQTGRDEHATNQYIRQRNMLQHDATPMTFRFCLHMTSTPVTIFLWNWEEGAKREKERE
jgi:hypothetical protein